MTVYRRPDPIPLHRGAVTGELGLEPVRPEQRDLHTLVARQLFAAIASGHFPEGSILPNEQSLASELRISRTALREAVKGLVAKGLLETRRRRGTMVLERSRWNLLDPEVIGWLRRSEHSGAVSGQLWEAVATVLPGLAAATATRGKAAGLRSPGAWPTGNLVAARAQMLLELARAAGNRFLHSLVATALCDLLASDMAFLDDRTRWLDEKAWAELAMLVEQRRANDAERFIAARLAPATLPVA